LKDQPHINNLRAENGHRPTDPNDRIIGQTFKEWWRKIFQSHIGAYFYFIFSKRGNNNVPDE